MVASSPDNSATVTVIDDESIPIISIMADSGGFGESANQAPFKLTATGLTSTTTLMINATPAENGHDFLTTEVAGTAALISRLSLVIQIMITFISGELTIVHVR